MRGGRLTRRGVYEELRLMHLASVTMRKPITRLWDVDDLYQESKAAVDGGTRRLIAAVPHARVRVDVCLEWLYVVSVWDTRTKRESD